MFKKCLNDIAVNFLVGVYGTESIIFINKTVRLVLGLKSEAVTDRAFIDRMNFIVLTAVRYYGDTGICNGVKYMHLCFA